jgi:hypothetical protein
MVEGEGDLGCIVQDSKMLVHYKAKALKEIILCVDSGGEVIWCLAPLDVEFVETQ